MQTEFKISYVNGASVEVVGYDENQYDIKFYDNKTNELIHNTTLRCGYWTKTNRKYFTEWRIEIYLNNELIKTDLFDCTGKLVKITLDSTALGDKIAWVSYCEEFRKNHNCTLVVSCTAHDFFKQFYPDIKWVSLGVDLHNLYAAYHISVGVDNKIFEEGSKTLRERESSNRPINYIPNLTFFDKGLHPVHPMTVPLQKVSANCLGLEWSEIRPNFDVGIPDERPIKEKYVCISEFASAKGMKSWNNTIGWKTVVSELKSLGYKVISISKEKTELHNIESRNGDFPLSDRMWYLKHCEFFIGLSSGLSWLAWAMQKKVVMIGGFTEDWNEFIEDNIRVKNYNACGGCFNSEKHCDKLVCFHWSWCPEDKNFECSRKISPKMVMTKIKENNLV
jgi:autotransporter strand-loop-strand O-heptosyltransferase